MAEQSDVTTANVAPDPLEIDSAARACGVETDYWDIWGQQHHASTELEAAILRSLSVDTSSSTALQSAMARREQGRWLTPLPPAIFLTQGPAPFEIPVSLPAERADSPAVLHLRTEDATVRDVEIALSELPISEEAVISWPACRVD